MSAIHFLSFSVDVVTSQVTLATHRGVAFLGKDWIYF